MTKRLWLVVAVVLLSACSTAPPPIPTITPRPTLPPRLPPTALPPVTNLGVLALGESLTVDLPGGVPVDVDFVLPDDAVVRISGRALSDDGAGNALDVVLSVLTPTDEQLAYNDDGGLQAGEPFAPSDAVIDGLVLPGGDYRVRVNAFNGFQAGTIELRIDAAQ